MLLRVNLKRQNNSGNMHEVYHSTLEDNMVEEISGDESRDVSAFEKGYEREIGAINLAESTFGENLQDEDDFISPLPDEDYDKNAGPGGRGAQYQMFPTSLDSPRIDDGESLGVSVLTEDTYGYEVRMKSKKFNEEREVYPEVTSQEMSRDEGSSVENYSAHNQSQNYGLDHESMMSSKSGKSTSIYKSATPLVLNENISKSQNKMLVNGRMNNDDAGHYGERKKSNHVPVQDNNRGRPSGPKLRRKRSVTSKLRSLPPFRRNIDKASTADTSQYGSQASVQMSLTSSDNTAMVDNRMFINLIA